MLLVHLHTCLGFGALLWKAFPVSVVRIYFVTSGHVMNECCGLGSGRGGVGVRVGSLIWSLITRKSDDLKK